MGPTCAVLPLSTTAFWVEIGGKWIGTPTPGAVQFRFVNQLKSVGTKGPCHVSVGVWACKTDGPRKSNFSTTATTQQLLHRTPDQNSVEHFTISL
jgi:hypothetical protein